jgi:hypothetical protein
VTAKPPANRPYIRQNATSRGRLEENPHRRKTEMATPTVESNITVVTCKRSIRTPTTMVPITADMLIRERRSVPVEVVRPKERAKEGI